MQASLEQIETRTNEEADMKPPKQAKPVKIRKSTARIEPGVVRSDSCEDNCYRRNLTGAALKMCLGACAAFSENSD
jgi:hypothetical protein